MQRFNHGVGIPRLQEVSKAYGTVQAVKEGESSGTPGGILYLYRSTRPSVLPDTPAQEDDLKPILHSPQTGKGLHWVVTVHG